MHIKNLHLFYIVIFMVIIIATNILFNHISIKKSNNGDKSEGFHPIHRHFGYPSYWYNRYNPYTYTAPYYFYSSTYPYYYFTPSNCMRTLFDGIQCFA